jgi:hypothetical protein
MTVDCWVVLNSDTAYKEANVINAMEAERGDPVNFWNGTLDAAKATMEELKTKTK